MQTTTQTAIFDGKEYPVPEGYRLKGNRGYNEGLRRYLWLPKKGDYVYNPTDENGVGMYRYVRWDASPKEKGHNYAYCMDGWARLKCLKTGKYLWASNLSARACILLVKEA